MSKQTIIIADIQELVMKILKTGSATEEEGIAIDTLEEELFKEKSFIVSKALEGSTQGEEVATLFFNAKIKEGVLKLVEYTIAPEDFFGFIQYHYDEEHADEDLIKMFTKEFIADIDKKYLYLTSE